MLTCELHITLGRYHDGELAAPQRRGMEEHLRECRQCAAELEQMRLISQTVRAGVAEVRPRASEDFLARLAALAPNVERQTVLRFVTRLTAAAAAILVAGSIAWLSGANPSAAWLNRVNPWSAHPVAVTPPQPAVATALGPEERVVLDPESAVVSADSDSALTAEPQFDFISQELSGGRP